ncbi:MAG: glutamine amidotransferase [Lachnospiraceae bacterium]|nr:glutamine amidotransferase [Ruminococcus sp.]MCM1275920.1 glutamine amidotransferase [Lachnospiraceae bacterium]
MKILHLFHDLMNLYGDYANVLALERALAERGEESEIMRRSVGDSLYFSEFDFIYIGSGTERSQKAALEYLRGYGDALKNAAESGAVILATGNSFEMFGRKITDRDKKVYEGLGLFDFITEEGKERVVTDSEVEFEGRRLIGFVNKASDVYGIKEPFFTVEQGAGNNINDTVCEGVHIGNFYGTHIIGPLLIRNPFMAEYFAELLLSRE